MSVINTTRNVKYRCEANLFDKTKPVDRCLCWTENELQSSRQSVIDQIKPKVSKISREYSKDRKGFQKAYEVWRKGSKNQSNFLINHYWLYVRKSVQKRALACVFPRMPYREALERACLTSIREHHEDITKSLFRSISENQNSKLHHLIPEAYSPHYNFRRQRTYNVPAAKTKRFANSFFVKCAAETNSSLRWMRTS